MDREPLEEAGPRERAGEDHHPGQQEDDVEVDGRERLLLVDDPEDDEQQAAEQRDQGPVEALGRDEGIGDEEDAARDPGVHQTAAGGCLRPVPAPGCGRAVPRGPNPVSGSGAGDRRHAFTGGLVPGRHHR